MQLTKKCARAFLKRKKVKPKKLLDDILEFVAQCNDFIVLLCFKEDGPFFKDAETETLLQNTVQERIDAVTKAQLPFIRNDFFQLASRFDQCTDPLVLQELTEAFTELLDSVTPENCPEWVTFAFFNIDREDVEPPGSLPNWIALAERLTK